MIKSDLKHYRANENTLIAMSGGRTSAFMLHQVLLAYNYELPDHIKIIFNNTGKEMPETLNFVRDIETNWDVKIAWVESYCKPYAGEKKNKKHSYDLKIVNHETAARNGEPFKQLVEMHDSLPNPVTRYCSGQLKQRASSRYMTRILEWETPSQCFIGIRADEHRRAMKIHNTLGEGQDRFCPLFVDGITKHDVGEFWANNDFDLRLPNNKGVTDWGNCDLCFLKSYSKKQSIISARPDLADWWVDCEKSAKTAGSGGVFRSDHPNYESMKLIASDGDMFGYEDDKSISCFCGD